MRDQFDSNYDLAFNEFFSLRAWRQFFAIFAVKGFSAGRLSIFTLPMAFIGGKLPDPFSHWGSENETDGG
ncbi:MAG: hypothetical protein DMG82_04140 [Acidobacteria bacterium]|nr:MAG: hypothetical protein DMG82_04140 [Acidobacteriota bacterium]